MKRITHEPSLSGKASEPGDLAIGGNPPSGYPADDFVDARMQSVGLHGVEINTRLTPWSYSIHDEPGD